MKNVKELFDFILLLEEKYPVDTWKIDEVYVWPYLRITIYLNYYYKMNGSKSENQKTDFRIKTERAISTYLKYPFKYFQDFKKNKGISSKEQALFFSNGTAFTKLYNGEWFDKFCDPIADSLETKEIKSIRFDPTNFYYNPRYRPSKFIQPMLYSSMLFAYFNNKQPTYSSLKEYDNFLKDLEKNQISTSIYILPKLIRRVKIIQSIKKYFIKKLKGSNIKIVFLVCYYSDFGYALNLACHELGIKTIDIQHGIQNHYHIAYAQWNKVPKNGFSILPNYFWNWDKLSITAIEKWNINITDNHKTILGGQPFFTVWDNQKVLTYYDSIFDELLEKNKPLLLIALSPDNTTEEELKELLLTIQKTKNKYNWWLRLHPHMLKKEASIIALLKKHEIYNVNIREATNLPLPIILKNAHLHLTYHSSVVIEANSYGLFSIILSEHGKMVHSSFIKNKEAVSVNQNEDIQKQIVKLLDAKQKPKNKIKENNKNYQTAIEFFVNEIKKL